MTLRLKLKFLLLETSVSCLGFYMDGNKFLKAEYSFNNNLNPQPSKQ